MTAFLIAFAVITLWASSLIVHPFGRCPRCWGRGNIRKKGRRKAPKCWMCHGLKRRQRFGSRLVHRIRRQVAAHWRGPR
jgi:hypothetical protein